MRKKAIVKNKMYTHQRYTFELRVCVTKDHKNKDRTALIHNHLERFQKDFIYFRMIGSTVTYMIRARVGTTF